jgi:hypothetical protein
LDVSGRIRGVQDMRKKLPIGFDRFEKIIMNNYYYVDKTMFIADFINKSGEVNLFTRPRRFGKSLNMSMLQTFFEIGCEKTFFDGLNIIQQKELCDQYMGQFPVISISLKSVDGLSFEAARSAICNVIGIEAMRFHFLKESKVLNAEDKERYQQLIEIDKTNKKVFSMSDDILTISLQTLSELLAKHYHRKVVVLIDEYDVPLDKAFQTGYYDEMVTLIRNMFHNVLKGNDNLQFAVLTGCLRISKESIFTGLNNLNVLSITDVYFDEYFGFTDKEVKEMLSYYNLDSHYHTIKEWYNGYRFGNVSVYCPWDVMKYCYTLLADQTAPPEDYWSNTSSNSIVRRFIHLSDQQTRDEIEQLIAGETIVKEIRPELTYDELDRNIDHLWSVLFTTGYLTTKERISAKTYKLAIPNREIRSLFISQIQEWFKESTREDTQMIEQFCMAFPNGESDVIENLLDDYLWNSISIRDNAIRNDMKENFYHGMLLGLLSYKQSWKVKSNVESGEGYLDILIETPKRIGVVIELKYAVDNNLEKACKDALEQMREKQYDAILIDDGMKKIMKYGIAFYKKNCKVVLG